MTRALSGTASTFKLSVAPLYIRQVVDITYGVSRDRYLSSFADVRPGVPATQRLSR